SPGCPRSWRGSRAVRQWWGSFRECTEGDGPTLRPRVRATAGLGSNSADSQRLGASLTRTVPARRGVMPSPKRRSDPPSSRPNPTLIAIVLVVIGATVALGAERLAPLTSSSPTPRPTASADAVLASQDPTLASDYPSDAPSDAPSASPV